jgi:hypothetical protein
MVPAYLEQAWTFKDMIPRLYLKFCEGSRSETIYNDDRRLIKMFVREFLDLICF